MSKREIEIKTNLGREEASRYLQELAQCLAAGRIVVQRGGEYVELRPAASLELEIEAAAKKDKEKISLELSWRQVEAQACCCDLKISAEAPPAEPAPLDATPPDAAPLDAALKAGEAAVATLAEPEKDKAAKGCRK